MLRRPVACATLALSVLANHAAFGQKDSDVLTLKSQSRLVLLDVVVRDGSGKTISGLRPEDFAVFEDDKPQQVRFFDAHSSRTASAAGGAESPHTPDKKLPPNQYNNVPASEAAATVNVILFDMLNTPTVEQVQARNEMVDFLRRTPTSENMAIYVLGSRLQALKGFNENRADLV